MKNFKKKILDTLKNKNKINSTLDYLSRIQKNLINNHSNPVFSDADKNKLLKKHAEFQELGESLYRHNMLTENGIESDVDENIVLKGGISNFIYIWHSENSDTTCEKCAELDGQEFSFEDEIPERPHPNCKCTVEIVEDKDYYEVDNNEDLNNKDKIPQKNNPKDNLPKKWIMPCDGPITSKFGPRKPPATGASDYHRGWDIGVPVGTPINSIADGTVINTGPATGYGLWVRINHGNIDGNTVTSEYGHISSSSVRPGQKVKQGEEIAKSGNTGTSTGPHLHITIKVNGKPIDPGNYIEF